MTWRERIAKAEARKRGLFGFALTGFTAHDGHLMASGDTCLMGEVAARYGLELFRLYSAVHDRDGISWMEPLDAIHADDPRRVSKLLDAIEDRAMVLKREGVTP